jgi:hypothetical protein
MPGLKCCRNTVVYIGMECQKKELPDPRPLWFLRVRETIGGSRRCCYRRLTFELAHARSPFISEVWTPDFDTFWKPMNGLVSLHCDRSSTSAE